MADEFSDALENSSAEALVSLKEGKGNSFTPPQSGRSLPPRVRKRNRLIFGDDEDHASSRSPRKQPKAIPAKGILSTPDKKAAQAIGVRLKNLLKLPKAHKWVCYEWFYSNIDQSLFEGENDFCICLRETFPQLKTRKLTRVEWCKIRRLMGKPRRCSAAFFTEERQALEKRRTKIRLLQQRKATEIDDFKDLPDEIPLPLVIGTKVTARLRKPQDGLFTGVIDALDTVNDTYRITFDRPGLGTHSIPDYEVLSNDVQDSIALSAFRRKPRPQTFTPPKFFPSLNSPQLENDPLMGYSPQKGAFDGLEEGTYGGFKIEFLRLVTKLSKILTIKKDLIKQLKELNTQAEKAQSYQEAMTEDFQKKYANVVLELCRLNEDLNSSLHGVQEHCKELAPDQGIQSIDDSSEIKSQCEDEANQLTAKFNVSQGSLQVKNGKLLKMISKLTSLMLQVKSFSENDFQSFEFKSLQTSLKEIKDELHHSNIKSFENNVEIHINHIQSGLSQMGNLHAFAAGTL